MTVQLPDQSVPRLVLDRSVLRRLRHTVGRETAAYRVDVEPDPARRALLGAPFESIDDVRRRLNRLESHFLERDDRRAVFATIYAEMTDRTVRAIDAGAFRDAAWMERYLVRFAEYYRRALRNYDRGAFGDVPDPWVVAFGTALGGDALVMQDAFLGINAHVNYDLALTLSAVGIDPRREEKYADHNEINELLRRLVSVLQEVLAERYAPGLEQLGEDLGTLDDVATTLGIAAGRERAWRVAAIRTAAEWAPIDRLTTWLLSRTATGTAFLLLEPPIPPSAMETLRSIEAGEVDVGSFAAEFHDRVDLDWN
ncbi:DUF5995 family protein [Halovivax limisalsi]|uniref:DUF5995 family protein n=1 Tax=Halovivax limisalsi TaxID=1453760 RepID=UPI001FFDDEA7|nr:DUF5995 family protein [Halovivax limisalsi]